MEQKQEYFVQLRKELEIVCTIMEEGKRVKYLMAKAKDRSDPMRHFYIVALVKLGATIKDDGTIQISKEVIEKLENWELRQKRLLDMVPFNELAQNKKLELRESSPALRLKPDYLRDI